MINVLYIIYSASHSKLLILTLAAHDGGDLDVETSVTPFAKFVLHGGKRRNKIVLYLKTGIA